MKVLVTGAAGRVGTAIVREFLEHDYQVRAFDKMPLEDELRSRVDMVYADITDRLALFRAAEGCEAIAHLAAIPHPGPADDILFHVNAVGTQYMLAAAEAQSIGRVAVASSYCTYGLPYARHAFDPQYLPLDEAHPALPQDIYGLSKVVNEQTAATYTRRTGMTTVCLRLTAVMNFGGERVQWRRRQLEHSNLRRNHDLWSYIDVRDAARAFRLAVEVPGEGSHIANIAARDSYTPYDIRSLVREHYPSLAEYTEGLEAHSSLLDTRRAEEVMGFVAERSWRAIPELAEAGALIEKEQQTESEKLTT